MEACRGAWECMGEDTCWPTCGSGEEILKSSYHVGSVRREGSLTITIRDYFMSGAHLIF